MNKSKITNCDGIFLIVEAHSCPLYDLGEEIKVEQGAISCSRYKPSCLILTQDIITLVSSKESVSIFSKLGGMGAPMPAKRQRYTCSGCAGSIGFEYKQEKEYATLQMTMLKEAEDQRRKKHLETFFYKMRQLPLFQPLEDDALTELILLLELKTILPDKVVVKEGAPGTSLYIVLAGKVVTIGEDGKRDEEIGAGEIFGTMGLLSGEPVQHTIQTLESTQIAILSAKNFRTVLKSFPVIQIFLFKLLVEQVQAAALKSGNFSSGMTGRLDEISAVDLFQLINTARKSCRVDLVVKSGRAVVLFSEGEIVYAQYLKLRNKEALFALLKEKKGRFSYTRGVSDKVAQMPILGGFMGLMMEGLQKIDEEDE